MNGKFLSPLKAHQVLDKAGKLHRGEIQLPPDIVAKKKEIEALTVKAELFVARVGVVDHGMIDDVVKAKLELDGLYARWGIE